MLPQMNQRLPASATFEAAIATILADVVALHGAEFGNAQLVHGAKLVMVAAHGLRSPFLLAFREVRTADGCACGRAWQTGEPVIVADVYQDEAYAPFRAIANEAGYRSVQSTPLIASNGIAFGMVSTLFANRYVPTEIEMGTCKAYCALAADRLQVLLERSSLALEAQKLHDALYGNLRVEDGTQTGALR